MPGLLGKKIGMTSVFSADGKNVPCTVIEAGPCVVTQVKTVEKDGYAAVQLGFQDKKEKHTTKPLMGHFKRAVRRQRALLRLRHRLQPGRHRRRGFRADHRHLAEIGRASCRERVFRAV